jgi:dATP pyrophosphohydrolase
MNITAGLIELHIFRAAKDAPEEIEFLLLKRAPKEIYPGTWQMVSGSIEEGETAAQAALRELQEETGLLPEKFWVAPLVNSFYAPPQDTINLIPVFAVQVRGKSKVKLSNEHTDFRWVKKGKAKSLLAWDGQRNAVELIHEYVTKKKKILKFVEVECGNIAKPAK